MLNTRSIHPFGWKQSLRDLVTGSRQSYHGLWPLRNGLQSRCGLVECLQIWGTTSENQKSDFFSHCSGSADLRGWNLGFWISRFPDCRFSRLFYVCKICSIHMLVRYRGINNKGVLDRPWTKWRVLIAISSTLKFQFTGKCWKVDFPMPCKTKSCQSSREYLRMLRALLPDTPKPPQFQPELPNKQFFQVFRFFQFFPIRY